MLKRIALITLFSLGTSAYAQTTLVNFGSDAYVSKNTNPAGIFTDNDTDVIGDSSLDGRRILTLTDSATAFSSATGLPSFDIAAEAISYSAGANATHPNAGGAILRNNVSLSAGTFDTMRFAVTSSATGTQEDIAHGIMLFNLGGNYNIADLSVSWASKTSLNMTSGTLRYAVNDGGTVRLSQDTVNLATSGGSENDVSGFSLNGLNWESYDTNGIGTAGIYSPGTFTSLTSSSISQVGFYVDLRDSAAGAVSWDLANFEVTAIPEPSTYGLLAGLGCLSFVGLRRRRRA